MQLIGMIDSPYVRRIAISFKMLNIPFEHLPLSVFSDYDKVAAINPVVKVPTLVTDDNIVLMDSNVILDYAQLIMAPGRSLMPTDPKTCVQAQRLLGIILAACEKAVQTVYEYNLRPAEIQYQPWLDRIHGQLTAALSLLEEEAQAAKPWLLGNELLQPDISCAVTVQFIRGKLASHIDINNYPALVALSQRAEATEAFKAFPYPAGA